MSYEVQNEYKTTDLGKGSSSWGARRISYLALTSMGTKEAKSYPGEREPQETESLGLPALLRLLVGMKGNGIIFLEQDPMIGKTV